MTFSNHSILPGYDKRRVSERVPLVGSQFRGPRSVVHRSDRPQGRFELGRRPVQQLGVRLRSRLARQEDDYQSSLSKTNW